ncbi:MAG TPA: hypothetical protein VES38_09010 [Methylotenera sp.]|nr:hypothetical protein [Methylotenera sp.]
MTIKLTPLLCMLMILSVLPSCRTIGITNPFGSGNVEQSRIPANATGYLCEGNKQFYVRMLSNGDAWLIYPDHEVNLTKSSDNNNRFTSGAITLLINGAETTLNDGEKIAYTACKPQVKK